MWAGVEAGKFDAVVCWKLDRLTRRFADTGSIIRRLESAGIDLVTVTERIDTSSPMGKGIFGLLISQAEQASADTSLRVSAAWAAQAAAGKPHVGGRRCFGFDKDCNQIPAEAKEARKIIRRLFAGEAREAIAADLNRRGVKTVGGKGWTGSTVRQWAVSPTVAGLRAHNGTMVPGTWNGLITPAEREQLLVQLGTVRGGTGKRVVPKYLLTGVVRCGLCQQRMYGQGARYACSPSHNPEACGKIGVSGDRVDEYVIEQLLSFLEGAASQPLAVAEDPAVVRREIKADEAALLNLDRSRFVLREIDAETWRPMRDEIEGRLAASKAALKAVEAASTLRPGTREELEHWWAKAGIAERRAAMRDAFSAVTIAPAIHQGPRFDTGRVGLTWRVLADLTPVASFDVGSRTGEVFVVPVERLNR